MRIGKRRWRYAARAIPPIRGTLPNVRRTIYRSRVGLFYRPNGAEASDEVSGESIADPSGGGRGPDRPRSRNHADRTRLRGRRPRSEEHTSELQSLMRISYAVFSFKK